MDNRVRKIPRTLTGSSCVVVGVWATASPRWVLGSFRERNPEGCTSAGDPPAADAIQGGQKIEEAAIPRGFTTDPPNARRWSGAEGGHVMGRGSVTREGIFTGMSSGAALAGVLKVAESLDSGTIVTIFPDRGDRYLSTTLFRSICSDCNP